MRWRKKKSRNAIAPAIGTLSASFFFHLNGARNAPSKTLESLLACKVQSIRALFVAFVISNEMYFCIFIGEWEWTTTHFYCLIAIIFIFHVDFSLSLLFVHFLECTNIVDRCFYSQSAAIQIPGYILFMHSQCKTQHVYKHCNNNALVSFIDFYFVKYAFKWRKC